MPVGMLFCLFFIYLQPPQVLQFPEHFLLDCPVDEYMVPA